MHLGLSTEDHFTDDYWRDAYANIPTRTPLELKQIYSLSPLHQRVLHYLPEKGRILDAGCGFGILSLLNPYTTNEIVGIDLSPALLERAKILNPQTHYEAGSLLSLPFENESFDMYIALASLELIPEGLLTPLQEACRVLKPGGKIILATMRLQPDFRFTFSRYVESTLGKFKLLKVPGPVEPFLPNGHAYWYQSSEIKKCLKESGTVIQCHEYVDLLGGLAYSRILGRLLRPFIFRKIQKGNLIPDQGFIHSLLKLLWSYWNLVIAEKA